MNWHNKHQQSCCKMMHPFDSLLMAIQRWQSLELIAVSLFDLFPVLIERYIGTKSSRLRRSTPMIMGCRNGSQDSITCLPRCVWKSSFLDGTKSLTSVFGTAMNSRHG